MRFMLIFLMLALLAEFSSQAEAQGLGHGHGMTQSFVYNDFTFRYTIGDSDFKDTPSWNPESDEAPLSTHKALGVARINLYRFAQDADKWEVEKINLERFEPHKWVYEIAFHCWDRRCSDTAVSFIVFVKMDGSVIEPEVTQKTEGAANDEPPYFVAPEHGRALFSFDPASQVFNR